MSGYFYSEGKSRKEVKSNSPDNKEEGDNLYKQLKEYKESELLFLHDKRVPASSSLCERLARVFKRKQKQVIVFQSQENPEYLCDSLSIVHFLRMNDSRVYQKIAEIFSRRKPPKLKMEGAAEIMA